MKRKIKYKTYFTTSRSTSLDIIITITGWFVAESKIRLCASSYTKRDGNVS